MMRSLYATAAERVVTGGFKFGIMMALLNTPALQITHLQDSDKHLTNKQQKPKTLWTQ